MYFFYNCEDPEIEVNRLIYEAFSSHTFLSFKAVRMVSGDPTAGLPIHI